MTRQTCTWNCPVLCDTLVLSQICLVVPNGSRVEEDESAMLACLGSSTSLSCLGYQIPGLHVSFLENPSDPPSQRGRKNRQKQSVKIPMFSRIFKSKRYLPKANLTSPKVNLKFSKANLKVFFWRAGTTPILKKTLREFGLKSWRPTNSESRSESCSENRFSHKLGRECHSENCSENAPEFRELLRELPFHSESIFFKIGVVPRFLIFVLWRLFGFQNCIWGVSRSYGVSKISKLHVRHFDIH